MSKPRAYTKEEVREQLLRHMKALAEYWDNVDRPTTLEKIEGALFSTLVIFDGGTVGLPAFDIVVRPHPEDEQFHKDHGDNWYEDGMVIGDDTELHHEFAQMEDL